MGQGEALPDCGVSASNALPETENPGVLKAQPMDGLVLMGKSLTAVHPGQPDHSRRTLLKLTSMAAAGQAGTHHSQALHRSLSNITSISGRLI